MMCRLSCQMGMLYKWILGFGIIKWCYTNVKLDNPDILIFN